MKNSLIQYKGGGYDGCFWEWNFCCFDKAGNFHDIYSSGHSGADTKEKAIKVIVDAFIYDLSKVKDVNEFQIENNAGNVIAVTKSIAALIDQGVDVDSIWYTCDKCGIRVERSGHVDPDSYTGDGGIGVIYDTKLCDECFYSLQSEEDEYLYEKEDYA